MEKQRKLGRGVAIIGAGMSKFGMFKDKDSRDLLVEAYKEMLSSVDKGVDPNDIDAMWMGNFSNDFWVAAWMVGPSASGSEKGTPNSNKSAPSSARVCTMSRLAWRVG